MQFTEGSPGTPRDISTLLTCKGEVTLDAGERPKTVVSALEPFREEVGMPQHEVS
jgi:hypothetical protein